MNVYGRARDTRLTELTERVGEAVLSGGERAHSVHLLPEKQEGESAPEVLDATYEVKEVVEAAGISTHRVITHVDIRCYGTYPAPVEGPRYALRYATGQNITPQRHCQCTTPNCARVGPLEYSPWR